MPLFLPLLLSTIGCANKSAPTPQSDSGVEGVSTTDTGDDTASPEPTPQPPTLVLTLDEACAMCVAAHVTQLEPGPITLLVSAPGDEFRPWVKVDAEAETVVPVLELRADQRYVVVARDDESGLMSDPASIDTLPLPPDFPPIELTQRVDGDLQPGLTLTAAVPQALDRSYVVAIDSDGEVVWYHRLEGLNLTLSVDEQRHIFATDSAVKGVRIHPFGREITVWGVDELGTETVHHELRPTPTGGLAFLSTEHRVIDGWHLPAFDWTASFDVIGDVINVHDASGQSVWSWSLMDHLNPLDVHTEDMHLNFWMMAPYDHLESPKDWSHANALVPHEEGWLMSLRNLDRIIKVDPATDAIEWTFGHRGDFELTGEGTWFSRQHAPQVLPNGNLLLYDNGNARPGQDPTVMPTSRVVEYSLDLGSRTATEVWSWSGGDSPVFCPIVGDVDRLENGNHLINDGAVFWGVVEMADGVRPHFSSRIREVIGRDAPEVLWEVQVGYPDDLSRPGWFTYRSLRVDSLYPAMNRP